MSNQIFFFKQLLKKELIAENCLLKKYQLSDKDYMSFIKDVKDKTVDNCLDYSFIN